MYTEQIQTAIMSFLELQTTQRHDDNDLLKTLSLMTTLFDF